MPGRQTVIAPVRFALLLMACAVVGSPASAQFRAGPGGGRDDCVLDRCEDREGRVQRPQRGDRDNWSPDRSMAEPSGRGRPEGAAPGRFDFYVLALSWSPSFCAAGDNRGRDQCDTGANDGFVVHGLWPQYDRGFPSDCDSPVRNLPASVLRDAAGVFPEPGLARYQWRKHGTCSGRSPSDYIADVRRARDRVAIPGELQQPTSSRRMAPLDIQRAFADANRNLRPGMMAVACRRGVLQEVRVCLSKDLRDFTPCPEVARAACRAQQISVPAAR